MLFYQDKAIKKPNIDSIGAVLKKKGSRNHLVTAILGSASFLEEEKTNFLPIINDVFNSMKHCFAHQETFNRISLNPNTPSIVTLYAKYNNFKNGLTLHNHNAYHLLMGYQDTVLRVSENIKKYKIHLDKNGLNQNT